MQQTEKTEERFAPDATHMVSQCLSHEYVGIGRVLHIYLLQIVQQQTKRSCRLHDKSLQITATIASNCTFSSETKKVPIRTESCQLCSVDFERKAINISGVLAGTTVQLS